MTGLRLNLGCGHSKLPGWINVDHFPGCQPDQVHNLEDFPWPWNDNSVSQMYMSHVLEHVGATTSVFIRILQEIYRVCAPDALVRVVVPHPRSDNFICDPTHVRPIMPGTFVMFSQAANQEVIDNGWSNTPLGIQTGIDLEILSVVITLEQYWQDELNAGEIAESDIDMLAFQYNNVITQFDITLQVKKPGRAR